MNDAQKYLKEVLEDKKNKAKDKNGNPAYYRQKLAKLQYVLAGEHVDFSQANGSIKCENGKIKECKPVKPQDKKNLLIDNKSIYDLILETASFEITTQALKNLRAEKVPDDVLDKLQSIKNQELIGEKEFLDILKTTIGEDQTVKLKSLILKHALGIEKTEILRSQEWTHLLILCGLEKDNTDKDFKPISFQHSPILYFMCLMDCMISGECPSDVAKVLDPFDNWEVKNANPERITSFHSWFCALDDCLDKCREVFKSTAKE